MADKRIVTLTLTNSCNLCCSYCYESNKARRGMPFSVAKKIIDYEMSLDTDKQIIEFDLFGGEPFLEFELIKQITEYLENGDFNKDWIIFTTTNGTLVHGEIQEWLKTKPHFICGLSLDGTKDMHDKNRSNSFDSIDIDFFVKQYPEQGIKMTISKETLPNLFDGLMFLHGLEVPISCNLAYGIDWSDKSNVELLEAELDKTIKYYLDNPSVKPCSMLDEDISKLGETRIESANIRKWCGVGTAMHTYDVDGVQYPCQFFMPLSIGEENAIKAKQIDFWEEIPLTFLDKKCADCNVRDICPTCYGSNYVATGNIYVKDKGYCELTKTVLKARSYFKAKQWELEQLTLSEEEEQLLLRSIKIIQDSLC